MSEETPLRAFEEWYLTHFMWSPSSGLVVTVKSADEAAARNIAFQPVLYLKTAASQSILKASEMADNEIWKFEEIKDSRLLTSLQEKDGFPYLRRSFGNDYERSMTVGSPRQPCFPRHFVLLSDYVDLEVLCGGYAIAPADPGKA
jgi:hypothetical protein